MSTTKKVILILSLSMFVLCGCVVVAGILIQRTSRAVIANTVNNDPGTVASVSADIASYTLPDGFEEAYAADMLGFKVLAHNGTDGHSHIYLVQAPDYITFDTDMLESRLRVATPDDPDVNLTNVQVVSKEEGMIRGEETVLVTSEGTNHDGETYREVSAAFQGNGGQAAVIISMPLKSWDQAAVEAFLKSIR